jgi:hypothetical protein
MAADGGGWGGAQQCVTAMTAHDGSAQRERQRQRSRQQHATTAADSDGRGSPNEAVVATTMKPPRGSDSRDDGDEAAVAATRQQRH